MKICWAKAPAPRSFFEKRADEEVAEDTETESEDKE
jgi:hypothetical protein